MGSTHIPVLVEEVMDLLRCEAHRIYVDATVGGGGHASEILKRTSPDGIVIGMDWDEEAIGQSRETLAVYGDRVKLFRENFIHLPRVLEALNISEVDGILFDLGLSSLQLEKRERGFSLKEEGPLDMRMDQRLERTAAELINDLSFEELDATLRGFGEERWSKQISAAIVEERKKRSILTTQDLRRIIYRAIPHRYHTRKIDPATRTFQALRIRVNQELENLRTALDTCWKCLKRGGRICIISFHSLEDRIVKETFRRLEHEGLLRRVTKKPVTPSKREREQNPRSRSAKLRCGERL